MKKQTKYKQTIGLKKWNKIFSALVSDYKKGKVDYNISRVRKEASDIYLGFKKVPLSKITKRKVVKGKVKKLKGKGKITLLATDLPKNETDISINWFGLDENVIPFNKKYPEIPIMILTPQNKLEFVGDVGNYEGSILQDFLEELRLEYKDNSEVILEGLVIDKDKNNPYFLLLASDMPKSKIPKNIAPAKLVEKTEIVEEIEVREVREVKRKKKVALKKKKDTKKKKEVPTEEIKKKKRGRPKGSTGKKKTPSKSSLADKNKAIELLMKQFELGLIDKKEFRTEKKDIMDNYKMGGKI